MNWLVLTKQGQVALLFLTSTLFLGCLVLVVESWAQDGLEDFYVIRKAVDPTHVEVAAAVPPAQSDPEVGGGGASVSATIGINSAELVQCETLPGIGPHTAAAIVTYRPQHGRFVHIDELTQVRGIGVRTLERLRPHLRLD
ncbi:MAG: hypothetical protein CME05_12670 [Gemmatimonadaceae bacterium]|nr:hypothetical protein [Gemmatimonadaceae bacterium]